MGLKFCNEAIIALQQIWPKHEAEQNFQMSPLQVRDPHTFCQLKAIIGMFVVGWIKGKLLIIINIQEALIERLGQNSIPFVVQIGSITPPSVQLLPAKRYTGAPIGTSYDIRVYTGR